MRGITIEGNTLRGCTDAMLRLGNATTANVSYVSVRNNTFIPLLATTYIVWVGGGTASRVTIKNNTVENTVGLASDYLYHNAAATSFAVVVDNWNFWGGSLGNTGTERYAEARLPRMWQGQPRAVREPIRTSTANTPESATSFISPCQ